MYWETDVSGVTLGLGLLLVKEGIYSTQDHAQDNEKLKDQQHVLKRAIKSWPVIQVSQNFDTAWTRDVPSLLLCQRCPCNYRPQTLGCNVQEGCSNTIIATATHHANKTPI